MRVSPRRSGVVGRHASEIYEKLPVIIVAMGYANSGYWKVCWQSVQTETNSFVIIKGDQKLNFICSLPVLPDGFPGPVLFSRNVDVVSLLEFLDVPVRDRGDKE